MNRLLVILICLCLAQGIRSQADFRPEWAVGVSAGSTFSSVTFSPKVKQGMKMGFGGGVTVRWITENHLGIQAEVNLMQSGWQEQYEIHPECQYKRTLSFLEVPFLTHFYFGSRRVRGFLNLGPQIGYLLSESTDSNLPEGFDPEESSDTYQHDKPVDKKFQWGLCGGPGMELRTGIGSFLLEGRYFYGLGNLYNSRKEDHFAQSPQQIITVKLTYLFSINHHKK
ncbi:MAG: porin family protein [Parabacteroides sp.]